MSYILKLGKNEGKTWSAPIGTLEGKLKQVDGKATIEEFAKQLAKQLKIKNGEVRIIGIQFAYHIY